MAETFIPWTLDDFPGVLWEFDPGAERFTAVHGRGLLGYPVEQWLEPGFWGRILHPEDREQTVRTCYAAIAQGEHHTLEYRVVAADGRVCWLHDFARVYRRADGRTLARGMMLDMTAGRAAEERQADAERRLAAVVDSYDGVVVLFDAEGRVKEARGRGLPKIHVDLSGTPKTLAELLGPLGAPHQAALRRALEGETVEYAFRSDLLAGVHFLVRMSPLLDGADRVTGAVAVVYDDTARVDRERRLSYQTALLRELAETSPDGIIVTDREGRIRMHNRRLPGMLKLEAGALVGRSTGDDLTIFAALRYPDEVRAKASALLKDPVGTHCGEMDLLDGSIYEWYSAPVTSESGAFDGRVLFLRDVTRRRTLEATLRRSEQLASLGLLAASVAHEMNNPLAYATTNVAYALEEAHRIRAAGSLVRHESVDELAAALRDAQDGLTRVGAIVRELRDFARDDAAGPLPTCPREVIQSAVRLVRPQLVSRAQLVISPRETQKVLANPQKLVQVMVNLLVNAAHAIPAGASDQRRIEVGSARTVDGRVELFVHDEGAGIPPEVLPRIFDPFFTTKPHGLGTGLGLAVCQQIVDGYGGELQVISRQGHGTKVRVLLKAAQPAPSA